MAIRVKDEGNQAEREVSASDAADGFAKGHYKPIGKVRVGRENQTGWVEAAEISGALANGWRPIEEEEAREITLAKEESTAGAQAVSLFESAASGASLGLSDVVATEILGVDPERMAARSEATGFVGDAAFLAGSLAPALLSGGSSAGATGGSLAGRGLGLAARGISAPVRALEGLGGLAERGVAKGLGGELGGLAGIGARGVVEGAGYEVGAQIHENVLGNREWNAELLSAGINGGMLGGGIGVSLPGIARVARGKAKLPDGAAAEVLARHVDGEPSSLLKRGAKLWAGGSASRAEGIEKTASKLLGTKEEANLLWRSQYDRPALMAERADEIVAATNRFNENVSRSVVESEGVFRKAAVARKMPAGADDVVPAMIRQRVGDLQPAITKQRLIAQEYKQGGLAREFGEVEERLRKLSHETDDLSRASAVDAHHNLQETWRDISEQVRSLSKAAYGPASDRAAMRALDHIKPVQVELNKILGDATVFGDDLAAMHTDLATTNAIAIGARKEAGKGSVGKLLDPRVPTTPEDAMRFAKSATKYGGDASVEKVGAVFEAEIAAMGAKARHFDDPVFKKRFDELTAAHKEWKSTMAKNAEVADLIEAHAAMGGGAATTGLLTAFGPSGAAVTGGLIGGLPGAMVGAAVNVLSRPQQALRTLSGIRHLLDQVDSRIGESVGRMITGMRGKSGAAKAAKPDAIDKAFGKGRKPKGLARTAVTAGASQAVAKSRTERQERAQKYQDRALLLAESPEALVRELGPLMYDVDQVAPGLAGHLQGNVQRAAIFLASKQPASYSEPYSPDPPILDSVALDKYERYVETVTDPLGVLDRMGNGTLTIEHAEALQEVYPEIFRHIQGEILTELGAAAEEGRRVPFSKRIEVGMLFDLPTDNSLLYRTPQAVPGAQQEEQEQQSQRSSVRAHKLEATDEKSTEISHLESSVA